MNINVTDYCTSGNASIGVIEALRNIENGDTLVFPTGEYHFYKAGLSILWFLRLT